MIAVLGHTNCGLFVEQTCVQLQWNICHGIAITFGIFDTEAATKNGMVRVFGEITTNAILDYQNVVRKTVKDIGYDDSNIGKHPPFFCAEIFGKVL